MCIRDSNYYNSEVDRQFSYRLVGNPDGLRKYTFDENTLTVSSKINSYSKLYGYSYQKIPAEIVMVLGVVQELSVLVQGYYLR